MRLCDENEDEIEIDHIDLTYINLGKDSKYKKCLSKMIITCIKQHLSNIWSSSMKKLSSIEAELKKSVAYKKACIYEQKNVLIFFGTSLSWSLDIFFSILQIYKDSQFNNTKIKNSKIQVQNKAQILRKSYMFLNKVCTRRGYININNNNINNNNNNNFNINKKIMIKCFGILRFFNSMFLMV